MGNYEGLTTTQNKQQIIDVQFGIDTTSDSDTTCTTPMESGASGTCSVGKYMTHPAFLAFGTNGMWVGKFETGYKGATTISEAEQNENNPSKIQIKPNVYSWRRVQIANAYLSSYHYKREYDSHMMKNTEWGAVAYLQHSQYGSQKSVRVNNNSSFLTGYAGALEPTCNHMGQSEECNRNESTLPGVDGVYTFNYDNPKSVVASTTGNYSGIYDMSGGSWEYVMGVMVNEAGIPCSGVDENSHSGFNGAYCAIAGELTTGIPMPSPKYYDVYQSSTSDSNYQRRILGDATGEMGPFFNQNNRFTGSWYEDEAYFVRFGAPWFYRSLYALGTGAGMFSFGIHYGNPVIDVSFRVVLVA